MCSRKDGDVTHDDGYFSKGKQLRGEYSEFCAKPDYIEVKNMGYRKSLEKDLSVEEGRPVINLFHWR